MTISCFAKKKESRSVYHHYYHHPSPLLVSEHVVGHSDAVVHSGNVPVLSPPREASWPAELVSSATQTGDREE